jgi:hypothetical protein
MLLYAINRNMRPTKMLRKLPHVMHPSSRPNIDLHEVLTVTPMKMQGSFHVFMGFCFSPSQQKIFGFQWQLQITRILRGHAPCSILFEHHSSSKGKNNDVEYGWLDGGFLNDITLDTYLEEWLHGLYYHFFHH